MKSFLVFLACLFFGCASSTPPARYVDPVAATTESTAALMEGDHVFCTGVWVSPEMLITANHCIQDEETGKVDDVVKIGLRHHLSVTGKVKAHDKEHDLALISAPRALGLHEVAPIASSTPRIGEPIQIVGHPSGMMWTYVKGNVAAYRVRDEMPSDLRDVLEAEHSNGPWLQVAAPVWYGNSGGGCFNSANELVGIASLKMQMPNSGFFVHVETIREFVKVNS